MGVNFESVNKSNTLSVFQAPKIPHQKVESNMYYHHQPCKRRLHYGPIRNCRGAIEVLDYADQLLGHIANVADQVVGHVLEAFSQPAK